MELLLLSNTQNHGMGVLTHALEEIERFLAGRHLTFVPYARADHDGYASQIREALAALGVGVTGVHESGDPVTALGEAEAVFVGGGNTFRLLRTLQRNGLVGTLRERVRAGMPYLGSSAGTVLSSPTLRTTNDMPIVRPDSFEALGFLPFQINPHYLDPDPASRHMGESRPKRLAEFLEENDVAVLGLREGAWLWVSAGQAWVRGENGARLFQRGTQPRELAPGTDVSFLLDFDPRWDCPSRDQR